jgi:hypothetical protein
MRRLTILGIGCAVAVASLVPLATPANASCTEVGDPSCTVAEVVEAGTCSATLLVKNPKNYAELGDCFTQPTH